MKTTLSIFTTLVISLILATFVFAQQVPNPRVSPTMISALTVDDTYVKVVYGLSLIHI